MANLVVVGQSRRQGQGPWFLLYLYLVEKVTAIGHTRATASRQACASSLWEIGAAFEQSPSRSELIRIQNSMPNACLSVFLSLCLAHR